MNATLDDAGLDRDALRKLQRQVTNRLAMAAWMGAKLPMGLLAGLRVPVLTDDRCEVTVPYRWLTQNPFRSTYFAVLAMAAEMSTGALGLQYVQAAPTKVSMLIVEMDAEFTKKATDLSTFTCSQGEELQRAVAHTLATGEPVTVRCESVGRNRAGEQVARFHFTWSFKRKSA